MSAELIEGAVERTRALIPTERQIVEGTDLPVELELQAFEADLADRPGPLTRLVAYLRSINPLGVEGPTLPLLTCGLSAFAISFDVAAVPITSPDIQSEFGLSVAALASAGSFLTVLALVFGVPMGYLADRASRVWIIRGSKLSFALSQAAAAAAPSFGLLNASKFVGQLAIIPGLSAQYPFLADIYPMRSRARVFGSLAFTGSLATVLAPSVAGFIDRDLGWRATYGFLAVITVVVAVLTFFLREPRRGELDRRELGIAADVVLEEDPPPKFGESLRGAWQIRTVRFMALSLSVFSLLGSAILIQASVEATKFGLDPVQRSFYATLSGIAILISLAFGSGIADRLLARRPAAMVSAQAAGAFAIAGGYALAAFASNLYAFEACVIVPGVLFALLQPASSTVTSMVAPARYRGMAQQVGTPFNIVVILVGPQLISTFSDGNDLQIVFLPFAAIISVAGFIYLAAAGYVTNDIRTAMAAAAAGEETRLARLAQQDKVLVCRDIDLTIDGVQILFGVDLDVRAGEVVALVGTNGAGKSTLLRAICGLQPATGGAVFFDGRDITYAATHESAQLGIVYMPGGQGVFPLMSVRDNLTTAAWQATDPAARIEEVLELFPRLRERLDVEAGTMSGGEQQMLALGQAFIMQPTLLMIDELSLGLAPAVVGQLLEAIRGMAAQGTTVLLVEQSINVALTVADRAIFMEKGEIRFDGSTEDLLARPDLIRSVFMGGTGSGASSRSRRPVVVSEEANERLLDCEGLSVAFGGLRVLDVVTIQVGAGEVVGIIGPNGAGKTTLFDLLSGYVRADAGAVRLDDIDITRMSPDARARLGLGRAFQNARLFPPLTVQENIAVALEKRASRSPVLGAVWAPSVRRSEKKLANRVEGFIELLGLGDYADKFVRELSTGTRRAVEVACQMAAEPKVLLLDEPSSGLAQAEAEALGPALLRIVRETGCGMLVIEHDLPLITSISDRLIAMELGTVVTTGTPQEVTTDPRVLASYLAASTDVIERSGSRIGSVLASLTDSPS